eukprot:Rmarinus@m.17425
MSSDFGRGFGQPDGTNTWSSSSPVSGGGSPNSVLGTPQGRRRSLSLSQMSSSSSPQIQAPRRRRDPGSPGPLQPLSPDGENSPTEPLATSPTFSGAPAMSGLLSPGSSSVSSPGTNTGTPGRGRVRLRRTSSLQVATSPDEWGGSPLRRPAAQPSCSDSGSHSHDPLSRSPQYHPRSPTLLATPSSSFSKHTPNVLVVSSDPSLRRLVELHLTNEAPQGDLDGRRIDRTPPSLSPRSSTAITLPGSPGGGASNQFVHVAATVHGCELTEDAVRMFCTLRPVLVVLACEQDSADLVLSSLNALLQVDKNAAIVVLSEAGDKSPLHSQLYETGVMDIIPLFPLASAELVHHYNARVSRKAVDRTSPSTRHGGGRMEFLGGMSADRGGKNGNAGGIVGGGVGGGVGGSMQRPMSASIRVAKKITVPAVSNHGLEEGALFSGGRAESEGDDVVGRHRSLSGESFRSVGSASDPDLGDSDNALVPVSSPVHPDSGRDSPVISDLILTDASPSPSLPSSRPRTAKRRMSGSALMGTQPTPKCPEELARQLHGAVLRHQFSEAGILQLVRSFMSVRSLREATTAISQGAKSVFEASAVALFLFERGVIRKITEAGSMKLKRTSNTPGLCVHVAETRSLINMMHPERHSSFSPTIDLAGSAFFCGPLCEPGSGSVVAVLQVVSSTATDVFPAEAEQWFRSVNDYAAAGLQLLVLRHRSRRDNLSRREAAFFRISLLRQSIHKPFRDDVESILRSILCLVGGCRCSLLRRDRAMTMVVECTVAGVWDLASGKDDDEWKAQIPEIKMDALRKPSILLDAASSGIVGHVAHTGETVVIPDVQNDSRYCVNSSVCFDKQVDEDLHGDGFVTRTVLAIPVRTSSTSDDVEGVILLRNRCPAEVDLGGFTEDDVSGLARLVGVVPWVKARESENRARQGVCVVIR